MGDYERNLSPEWIEMHNKVRDINYQLHLYDGNPEYDYENAIIEKENILKKIEKLEKDLENAKKEKYEFLKNVQADRYWLPDLVEKYRKRKDFPNLKSREELLKEMEEQGEILKKMYESEIGFRCSECNEKLDYFPPNRYNDEIYSNHGDSHGYSCIKRKSNR